MNQAIPTGTIGSSLDNSISMLVSLVTPFVMSKMGIDNIYFGLIFSLIIQMLNWLINANRTSNFNMMSFFDFDSRYFLYFAISFVVCFGTWRIFFYKKYITLTINSKKEMEYFFDYVRFNRQWYDMKDNSEIGDIDEIYANSVRDTTDSDYNSDANFSPNRIRITPSVNHKIKFMDPKLGISGYFIRKSKDFKSDKKVNEKTVTNTKKIKYVDLCIENNLMNRMGNIDLKMLMKQIISFVDDAKKNEHIVLYNVKVTVRNISRSGQLPDYIPGNTGIAFYEGPKKTIEHQKKIHWDTFFHPIKNELWDIIQSNILCNDARKMYGSPGRVSLLLYGPPGTGKSSFIQRIAMCLYRSVLSLDLRDLEKSQLYGYIFFPYAAILDSYKDAIIIFEEFDVSLEAMQKRELMDEETQYKTQHIKKDKEGNTIISYSSDRLNVTIKDLLEVFQGPIPRDESIIVATTNNYDKIKGICPELFRDGRMTPIHVGYIDVATLQEISMFYFAKKLKGRIPENITIPSCTIIELAIKIKISVSITEETKHNVFSERIFKLFNEQKI